MSRDTDRQPAPESHRAAELLQDSTELDHSGYPDLLNIQSVKNEQIKPAILDQSRVK